MKRKTMDIAITWLLVLGPLLIGAGLAIWGFVDSSRTIALWTGFSGCLLLLIAGALQLQTTIWQVNAAPPQDIGSAVDRLGKLLTDDKRPWISLDVEPIGALAYDDKGWNAGARWYVPIRYKLRNSGASPANGVSFFASIRPFNISVWPTGPDGKPVGKPIPGTDIAKELDAVCDFPAGMAGHGMGWGEPLFANEERQRNFILNGNPQFFEEAKKTPGYSGQFLVVACVVYGNSTNDLIYRTAKAFQLFKPKGNIDLNGEAVPLGQFGFVASPINSGYAK